MTVDIIKTDYFEQCATCPALLEASNNVEQEYGSQKSHFIVTLTCRSTDTKRAKAQIWLKIQSGNITETDYTAETTCEGQQTINKAMSSRAR